MSVDIEEIAYLRCDHADVASGQCIVTFPRLIRDGYPANAEALEVMCRQARDKGWQAEPRSEGLKGWSAPALCPDHAPPAT